MNKLSKILMGIIVILIIVIILLGYNCYILNNKKDVNTLNESEALCEAYKKIAKLSNITIEILDNTISNTSVEILITDNSKNG